MRKVEYIAEKDGTIEENLRQMGISSSICVRLRKRMGLIQIENEPVRIVDKVKKGQKFSVIYEDEKVKSVEPYDIPLDIVYEDDDLLVINKPSGLAVINTREHYGKSLENVLAGRYENFVYRPVNRLDRDTTGLMIIAKNQLAHSTLAKEHIERKYIAIVEGELKGHDIIEKKIARSETSIMERVISEKGQEAKTEYEVLESNEKYSIVALKLYTGRTHQIRVHMASIGHPLIMDGLYNRNKTANFMLDSGYVLKTFALHSYYIKFVHPVTKNVIELYKYPEYINKIDTNYI